MYKRQSYTDLEPIVRWLKFRPVAGVLFDFGMSSFHLQHSRRGFSFQRSERLDMRMNRMLPRSAADIVNHTSVREFETMLKSFGDERFAGRIARAIAVERTRDPITTTQDLVSIIRRAVPPWYRRGRIHFATRTFQALRMAVNRELENISSGLAAASRILAPGGRIVAIAYHSAEDRVVKHFFRNRDSRHGWHALVAVPLRPSAAEIAVNPRARSARLRAFEKLT